jgi:Ca2+-binding RTX toxin-like protein
MAPADDVIPNTVMSYSPLPGYGFGALSAYPAEPMPADVAALQVLYGAAEFNATDTIYRLDAREWRDGFHVVYDSGGNDILDASGLAAGVALDLAPGARSDIGVQVAALARQASGALESATNRDKHAESAGTSSENAIGTASNDVKRGNAAGNWLVGAGGDDRLEGRAGDDWLMGGDGNNTIDGGAGLDTALYAGSRAAYEVAVTGQQAWVRNIATGSQDILQGVERATFSDVTIDITLAGLPALAAGLLPAAGRRRARSRTRIRPAGGRPGIAPRAARAPTTAGWHRSAHRRSRRGATAATPRAAGAGPGSPQH